MSTRIDDLVPSPFIDLHDRLSFRGKIDSVSVSRLRCCSWGNVTINGWHPL